MAIPTNGLDFYLPFDADMDEKIHSLTGTLSSSSAATYFMLSSDTAGKFLRCIKTQGSSSYYLKYPGSESLMQYGTGDFSASFWLRSPNWSDFTQVVFEKKYNDSYDGFVVYSDGSEPVLDMRLRANTSSTSMDHFTETYCNSSVFLNWCFVRVGTVGYWYCNGVLDSTTEGAAVGSASSDELFKIGYSSSWPSKQAVFDLKALRIYNRALTDSEIQELSKEFADEGTSGGTGVVINGLFLSTSKPTANQKGLLVNNKFFIPFAESSGSGGTSAEYYKCASVDTSAKTWSGYKAVFDSTAGTWSFESDVTEGLAYTSVTPIVGSIYSADALARIQSLYQGEPSGLIFRAPLASDLVDIVGGVQGESWGTAPVYGQIDGKDCVTTNATGIRFDFDGMFEYIWSPRTIMLWFRRTGGSGWQNIYCPPDNLNIRCANMNVNYGYYGNEVSVGISNNVWYHHAFSVSENNIKWYINGELKTNNTTWTPSALLTHFRLATASGSASDGTSDPWYGQIADVRIYNRVLDSAEIQQIYEA